MADIEPPSFSLGLDLDFEPQSYNSPNLNDEPEDFLDLRVSDSDPDSPRHSPLTRLRRLRRCPARSSTLINVTPPLSAPSFADDDIEDFSSEENVRTDPLPTTQHRSVGSSSKCRLSGTGILKRPEEILIHNKKRKQYSSCLPTGIASNKGGSVVSDLTSSPLRSFRLLDSESDSDNQPQGVNVEGIVSGTDSSKINVQDHVFNKIGCEEIINKSASISQKQDLWKDFYVANDSSVPTPVFDEFCKEYFKGGKLDKAAPVANEFCARGMGSSIKYANNLMQTEALGSSVLPCHRYFFHDDLRIQRLVRSRLPFFCPLSSSGDKGNKICNASSIDYMSQFGNQDGAKQKPGRTQNITKSGSRSRKRNNKFNLEDDPQSAGPWINPKQTGISPKDAGKRRIRADGQSPSHWVTGENGKKVYITKTGQELTGRPAYIRFKKDNGGFRKSKKKGAPKKK